eukprot:4567820-Amphidinium_carterae.1
MAHTRFVGSLDTSVTKATWMSGPIPASLESPAVLLSHNLLQGSIPEHLLYGWDRLQKWVAVSTSVSRL